MSEQNLLEVRTSDKKYTVIQNPKGHTNVLRCGEPWRDVTGDNFILTLAQDLDACRENGGKLAAELIWIVEAIRAGKIKSKPIVDLSDEEATELPMITLEDHIWKALKAVGIKEKVEA